jgi:U6 snRNA-associated Sm-like protein LSm4
MSTFPRDFLYGCRGMLVHVGLRNGDVYSGYVAACDSFMNLRLSAAVRTRGGETAQLEDAMIRGSAIKFVSMPRAVEDGVRKARADGRPRRPPAERARGRGGPRRGGS